MSPNNKTGAKCLNNLHLCLNENETLEDDKEEVEVVDSDKEEEEEQKDEIKDWETVPNTPNKEAEAGSQKEQGEAVMEGEASKGEEGETLDVDNDNDDNDASGEEVRVPVQEKPKVTPRKSRRLASKKKQPVVLDDDIAKPPSLKPATPPPHHNPSPPPSPIPSTPPTHTTPSFDDFTKPTSIPTAPSDSILTQLKDLQSQLSAFQDEVRVSLASISDRLTQMEARLGAKLDTVEVQTKYVDEEKHDP